VFRGFVAEPNFNAINAVDAGIAGGGAAQNLDVGSGEEAEVSEVVAHFFGEIDAFHYARTAHLRVAQSCDFHLRPISDQLSPL